LVGIGEEVVEGKSLGPRLRQTLGRLLAGDSEKQIALRLDISRHTVHVYVKNLYRRFEVNSRGELMAKFTVRQRADERPQATMRLG
jgi:DNA-binding CsgD family transcriptional regulator